jgi:peptide/nickel transport system ATP-binding protein
MSAAAALSVENLSVAFRTRGGTVKALENVSFSVAKGETVAVVGESGSGKSVTAYAVMGILDAAGRVTGGRAMLGGLDLIAAPKDVLAGVRGRELAMIFQNPRSALNPIRKVGKQITDVLLRHANVTPRAAPKEAIRLLEAVGITDPARRAEAYPFELSGGMCQRVMIAIALAANPSLLIADEPTTGLDVTTQAIIMDIIAERAAASGMATVFITHDLGLAAERADRIVVMHAGHVVEIASTKDIFARPRHPYTAELLAATPTAESTLESLRTIAGGLPDLRRADLPGCRFAERCRFRTSACDAALPMIAPGAISGSACHHPLQPAAAPASRRRKAAA